MRGMQLLVASGENQGCSMLASFFVEVETIFLYKQGVVHFHVSCRESTMLFGTLKKRKGQIIRTSVTNRFEVPRGSTLDLPC